MYNIPEVIGEGTYGCAIKPSLKCKNKKINYDNKISKVLLDKDANSELTEYNMIDKIDKNKVFYLGKPEICKPKYNFVNVKSIQKCNSISQVIKDAVKENFKKLSLLVMADGGINLKTYSTNIYKKTEKQIFAFFLEAHRILLGLKVFIDNGVVHHDLKPGNIVYNENTNRMNFIDFGLTHTTKNLLDESDKSTNWLADSYHWSYPFEIMFFNKDDYNKMANSTISEKTQYINDITETDTTKISRLSNRMRFYNENFMKSFKTFLSMVLLPEQMVNKVLHINKYVKDFHQTILRDVVPGNYNNFINKSINTIDIYGTGIAFITVLNKCSSLLNKNAYDDLKALFLNMVSSDLSKRYEINEVLTIYENILQQHNFLPPNMSFENHILVNNSKLNKLNNNLSIIDTDDVKISKKLVQEYINISPKKQCPQNKELNQKTRRCVKECKPNYTRNDLFKCVRTPKPTKTKTKKTKTKKTFNQKKPLTKKTARK